MCIRDSDATRAVMFVLPAPVKSACSTTPIRALKTRRRPTNLKKKCSTLSARSTLPEDVPTAVSVQGLSLIHIYSDIVIITSGIARKPGQTRLELAQTNVNITKEIIPEITNYAPNAIYIIVSNPVDILTYTFHKFSKIPENHIIEMCIRDRACIGCA